MRRPFALGELTVTVDASVGIVTYPTHGEDAETLVQRADIAMYLAKGRGGGEALYDPAEDPYDPERLRLIGELRDAISDGKLQLHYQPQFSAGDLRLVGVEALVRWQHPTRGLLAPGEFIPLAEHTGLIRPLTLEVLRKAARQWRAWHEDGIEVTVAVNLSVANLLDNQLVDDLAAHPHRRAHVRRVPRARDHREHGHDRSRPDDRGARTPRRDEHPTVRR